jgi:hypothetical protein
MSLERAYVNCERCHGLAKKEIDKSTIVLQYNDPETRKKLLYENDQVYEARNEAMKALEDAIIYSDNGSIEGKALESCRGCDYSLPKIVEIVGKEEED